MGELLHKLGDGEHLGAKCLKWCSHVSYGRVEFVIEGCFRGCLFELETTEVCSESVNFLVACR